MIDFRSGREPKSSSFDYIQIRIASPRRSAGRATRKSASGSSCRASAPGGRGCEVTSPNHQLPSFKPERDGFCERIFGR